MTRAGGRANATSPRCAAAITGPNRCRAGDSISRSRASWYGRCPTAAATGSSRPPTREMARDRDAPGTTWSGPCGDRQRTVRELRFPASRWWGGAVMAEPREMAGPGDVPAAAEGRGRGGLRASHADREQVIGTLKVAFVQGRLTRDELDARVDRVYASRTYAELGEVTADIP